MRILFVAMANSIHTARWVSQLHDTGWDIHVFDAAESTVHPELKGVTAYTFYRPVKSACNVRKLHTVWPFARGAHCVRRNFPWVTKVLLRPRTETLALLIRKLKPDIIHSLEMQRESYPLLEVRQKLGKRFSMPWIYSSWGSDIFLFGRQPDHIERIRAVLTTCDYYISDCQRDVSLARDLGFKGEVLGVFPGPGGFDIQHMLTMRQAGATSDRKVIALKGYHGWAGHALVALQALHQCADALRSYDIVIYMADDNVRSAAEHVSSVTGLSIAVLPHSPHEEIMKLMGRSRIAIGVSISDGTPNTMLEAMVMGAFPVQSDTISTAEWITHGKNGLLVPPEDPEAIATAVRHALADDDLVDRAAEINARLTAERIDRSVIQPQVIAMYEKVFAQAGQRRMKTTRREISRV